MQQQQPRHEKTVPEQYKPYLVQFMSFRDGRNYQKDDIFSNEELASITPQQLVRFMRKINSIKLVYIKRTVAIIIYPIFSYLYLSK